MKNIYFELKSEIDAVLALIELHAGKDMEELLIKQEGLNIIWNRGKQSEVKVDGIPYELETDCIIFLTENQKIETQNFDTIRIIRFNRLFYCVEEDDSLVGCRGILFYGGAKIPKVRIPKIRLNQFQLLWEVLIMEMEEEKDPLQIEMMQTLLKRFLILSLRLLKEQDMSLPTDDGNLLLIREFNYLVEKNFKECTRVADYAKLLNKSPKTLSNLFRKHHSETPLQIIVQRRLLAAKRKLKDNKQSIKEIAFELGFNDIQTFSHFFKKNEGRSPRSFKEQIASKSVGYK